MFLKLAIGLQSRVWVAKEQLRNQRGAQAIEYVGLAALVIAIMGAIMAGVKGDTTMGKAIVTKFENWIATAFN